MYSRFVYWVRKMHGWIGLWGAVLGLVFGLSGIWLNHRAVLKLPLAQQRSIDSVVLPDPAPETPDALAAWLQHGLQLKAPPASVRIEPARSVEWSEAGSKQPPLRQPERWILNFGGPDEITQVEYWRGNRSAGVRTTRNGFIATLTNMHKGTGMGLPWILLVDTLAGSMIFLSLSGVILWVQQNRRRLAGLGIFSLSLLLGVAAVAVRL